MRQKPDEWDQMGWPTHFRAAGAMRLIAYQRGVQATAAHSMIRPEISLPTVSGAIQSENCRSHSCNGFKRQSFRVAGSLPKSSVPRATQLDFVNLFGLSRDTNTAGD